MAALAVLFHHSYASFLEEASRQSFLGAAAWLPMDLGKRGVELFLVISGFCIHMGYARARSRSQDVRLDFVRFWKRRLLRLYPPYLASMVLSLSVGILYATMRARREGLPLCKRCLEHVLPSVSPRRYGSIGISIPTFGARSISWRIPRHRPIGGRSWPASMPAA